MDRDDPAVETRWLAERRREVETYLANDGMLHGDVADAPSCFLAPCLSLWRVVEGAPKRLWLWVVAGDIPCDWIGGDEAFDARAAMAAFASRWLRIAESMDAGRASEFGTIGAPEDWRVLAPLLRSRATLLRGCRGRWDVVDGAKLTVAATTQANSTVQRTGRKPARR
jgi:hypothetical protein